MLALSFSSSACDVVLLHAGVNDASKARDSFADDLDATFAFSLRALSSLSPRRIVLSTACLTKSSDVNLRVAAFNQRLRDLARDGGFHVLSNDNLRFTDLADEVHLNAAVAARLYRNIVSCLQSLYA